MTVIGILTPWQAEARFPAYYRQFVSAGREAGARVFLIVPPEGGRFAEGAWRGYALAGNGWAPVPIPKPDIVINRFGRFLRSPAELEDYYRFREEAGVPFANRIVNDKMHLMRKLRQAPGVGGQLPDTEEFSAEALREWLSRYDLVYVKPINGTGGRGVYRIERERDGKYRLFGHDVHRRNPVSDACGLDAAVDRMTDAAKDGGYLVQQGVDLRLLPERNCDLRLLLQKENGAWRATGTAVRVGRKGSPVSNLHGGGTGHRSEPFLTERFGKRRCKQILQECERLALAAARAIEANYGRMLELGFDLGIDTKGKVWLIEVNTMPQRDLFKVTGQHETYRLAFARPIREAVRLAKAEAGKG